MPSWGITYGSLAPALQEEVSAKPMRKTNTIRGVAKMRAEYDFSTGVRGKYAKRFSKGTNLIVLDPDVAKVFKDSKAVNNVLRALAKIAIRKAP